MVSDLNNFSHQLCKIATTKKVFTDFHHLFTPCNGLFAPIAQSPMSIFFRFSESLGKRNGKKWSKIVKLLLMKCLLLPGKTKVHFFRQIVFIMNFYFITCHLSPVTCQKSHVNYHLLIVTCHLTITEGRE